MTDPSQPGSHAAPEILPNGTRIDGRYEVLGVLGRGGYATVYRARHVHMGRDAAVKVLDAQRTLDTEVLDNEAERFLREARIASSIHHPNVVTIYDFGFDAGRRPYIAMELLEGYDLSVELRRNGPLAPARALRLFKPVLEALGAGHASGIVHKDLKPANLFITHPGTPHETMLVLDFGVARTAEAQGMNLTGTGELLGTPRYLAPEYIQSQTATPAVDVYQMALILSEALCGRSAVEGAPYQAMMCHCTGNLAIPHVLLNGPVGSVFRRAVAIDHRERYRDCGAFKAALESVESAFVGLPAIRPPASSSGIVDTGRIVENDTSRTPAPFGMPGAMHPTDATIVSSSGPLASPHVHPAPEGNNSGKIIVLAVLIAVVLIGGVVAALVLPGGSDASGASDDDAGQRAVAAERPEADPQLVAPTDLDPDPAIIHEDPVVDLARAVIVSEPLGASVRLDGEDRGVTPLTLELPIGERFELVIERYGYEPWTGELVAEADAEPFVAVLEALTDDGATEASDDTDGTEAAASATTDATDDDDDDASSRRRKRKKEPRKGWVVAP